jgi:predicted nucleotide-binding protein
MKQLHISNANYNATQFLTRIQDLFLRDKDLLGGVTQQAALVRTDGGELQHVITKIDVHSRSEAAAVPEVLDYGSLVFVREQLTTENLLTRLQGLSEKQFAVGEWTVKSTGLGFNDYYEPSHNSYYDWPCTVFQIAFHKAQFSFEPLIHPRLKSFPSAYEAVGRLLGFKQFNDSSDARLGSIVLCVPNFNARLERLSLKGKKLIVEVAGAASPASLKLDGSYKNETEAASLEKQLDSRDPVLDLSFVPSVLNLYLISTEGFIADFHDENEYFSRGANAVLPKRPARAPAPIFGINAPDEVETLPADIATSKRVFVIHGHNTAVKESVARFLEKLCLEAIILHEKPNKGNTIIEKFELHSEAGFAIALLTGDDEARTPAFDAPFKKRARQNVLFEFGYFIGKLGRTRVCALVEEGVEIPSDYQGVVYITLDGAGHWKMDLVRELKAAGLDVDANLAL